MRVKRNRFTVDRGDGKLLGVCAGLARSMNVDATLIRIGLVVITLMGAFPWSVIAYLAAAWVGRNRSPEQDYARVTSSEESRQRLRSLDLRLQAIETQAASVNSRVAREIEALR